MAKREHVKTPCPFCSWCKRSFHLPDHLITHHANEIRIRPTTNEHCVYAYVLDKKREIGFCVCLTCKKGQMDDGLVGNGARWVELHAKNTECRKAHRTRLAEFKTYIASLVTSSEVSTPIPSSINNVSTLWDTLKTNSNFSGIMKEVEHDCMDTHDEDLGEYTFDPKIGFEHIMDYAISYKKKYDSYYQEREKYTKERVEMRNDMTALKNEIDELRARVTMLERQNKRYKEACPSLVAEDPQ